MKKLNLYKMALFLTVVSCAVCRGQEKQPDVYVAGLTTNTMGTLVATIWKNGTAQRLTGVTREIANAMAFSVYVSDYGVYVAGGESKIRNSDNTALLWENGMVQYLKNTNSAFANSVYISGNNVYIAGDGKTAQNKTVAILWKNGAAQNLGNGHANSVFVSNGDVYVAGSKTWKNGNVLYNNEGGNSVFVSGRDVYVAGRVGANAVLWKNGIAKSLSDTSTKGEANSVFVSGNDVYVAGREESKKEYAYGLHHNVAVLWKNGVAQRLTDESKNAEAKSVYVLGNDVYVAGHEGNNAVLWKNNVPQILLNGGVATAAYSVFVK